MTGSGSSAISFTRFSTSILLWPGTVFRFSAEWWPPSMWFPGHERTCTLCNMPFCPSDPLCPGLSSTDSAVALSSQQLQVVTVPMEHLEGCILGCPTIDNCDHRCQPGQLGSALSGSHGAGLLVSPKVLLDDQSARGMGCLPGSSLFSCPDLASSSVHTIRQFYNGGLYQPIRQNQITQSGQGDEPHLSLGRMPSPSTLGTAYSRYGEHSGRSPQSAHLGDLCRSSEWELALWAQLEKGTMLSGYGCPSSALAQGLPAVYLFSLASDLGKRFCAA